MVKLGVINFLRKLLGLHPLQRLTFQDIAGLCDREIERVSGLTSYMKGKKSSEFQRGKGQL